ncbi:MAG: hydrogenase nickel incorporation protein HypB [Candidatus Thermoplasmatota archaeon]|nr:hydrogenase nickel incorporation protein HypB [Candidatus Thermoplasmatota archaeon]
MHQLVSIDMEKDLLEANRRLANDNHDLLKKNEIISVDLMGSIGSGKTLLIERLAELLRSKDRRVGVITGDVAGDDDFKRVSSLEDVKAVNVNTGKECHIDAHLAEHAIEDMDLGSIDVLLIENVGNLVCPADFPLGADKRAVIISVTEGDDMVRKHPLIFRIADIVVINKSDLAEIMEVDLEVLKNDLETVKPGARLVITDAKHGIGIEDLAQAMGLL